MSSASFYRINVIDIPKRKIILKNISPNLLSYIDFDLIKRPLIYMETADTSSSSLKYFDENEIIRYIIAGLQLFKKNIQKDDPLFSTLGVSKSRFPVDGALLQIMNSIAPIRSPEIIEKIWITISSTPQNIDYFARALSQIMASSLPIKFQIHVDKKNIFQGVLLRVYSEISNLRKTLTLLKDHEVPLYNLDIDEPSHIPENLDLNIPLLREI